MRVSCIIYFHVRPFFKEKTRRKFLTSNLEKRNWLNFVDPKLKQIPTDMELPSNVARSRLAVLAAHLSAATLESPLMPSSLEANCVSARTMVPPPEILKGTLTIVDERTGKRYQVQISEEGTIKATDLKKVHKWINGSVACFPVSESVLFVCFVVIDFTLGSSVVLD